METLSIDNSAPLPVRRPASVAELRDLVRQARAAGQGVYPVGGRTALGVGLPPIKPGTALDTTALDRVIDYPARDMTITAQAGVTLAALQAELAKEGQWLPIDVPSPERATLGGAIALNQSGPRRYGYGTLRDYVIGISFVTDDGVEVKAGGRVVKNVAGYDLMKLQIGAVGTLGVVTQVTLKVKPKPEASAVLNLACQPASLAVTLDRIHASGTRPVAVELGVTNADARPLWSLSVLFEEKAAAVEWQVNTLLAEVGSGVADVSADRGEDATAAVGKLCAPVEVPRGAVGFRASLPPSRTAEFCNEIGNPQVFPHGAAIRAHALSGVVSGYLPYNPAEDVTVAVGRLAELAAAAGGTLVLPHCPAEWKKSLPVWGKPPAGWDLMRHVKKTLDPDNVFNPGRLFGDA